MPKLTELKGADIRCEKCGKELNRKRAVMLELDTRTNLYTDKPIPSEFSQGGFWFGNDCAKEILR